ncbi:MAG: peptidase family protein, partial [Ilumatobacteraceae bacterium]|nr:peptidase family protein [Ilumatobacteraceae bacterium]
MAELLEVAERVAAQARGGEEIEAYVVRARDTSVRVYEGEIEQLSAAQSEGIGVRVIANGCQGFAYAGSLDPSAVADALSEARDNVTFGTRDEWAQLARPDGVAKAALDLWRPELEHTPTAPKVALATELERLARSGDPRVA